MNKETLITNFAEYSLVLSEELEIIFRMLKFGSIIILNLLYIFCMSTGVLVGMCAYVCSWKL